MPALWLSLLCSGCGETCDDGEDCAADASAPADAGAEDAAADIAASIDTGPTSDAVDVEAAKDVGLDTGPAPECTVAGDCTDTGTCLVASCEGGKCAYKPVVGKCGAAKSECQFWICHPKTGACEQALQTDQVACDDGDACSAASVCIGGKCAATTPKDCNDNEVCTADGCQDGVCTHDPMTDGAPCNDGQICTDKDSCKAGKCAPGTNLCPCDKDSDCSKLDDGDLCNGTLFCAKQKNGLTSCALNPATVVLCKEPDDGPCLVTSCDGKTGKCQALPSADGTACDDGDATTSGDACAGGKCVSGSVTKCPNDAWCALKKGDGDACNGTLFCHKSSGECRLNPTTIVTCKSADDTACARNLCDKKTGKCAMTPQPDGILCSDGNACTKSDSCASGKCAAGPNVCPCSDDGECAPWEDGNLCNGTLFCNKKAPGKHVCSLNPATVISCPTVDDTQCVKNTCAAKTGQCAPLQVPDGQVCDDGNACTGDDACKSGECMTGPKFLCECSVDADCGLFEDGDACNGSLFCLQTIGKCALNPKTVVVCPKTGDKPCLRNTCQAKTGDCKFETVADGKSCNDGNVCTAAAACVKGSCTLTKTKPCDDSNACTKDVCDPQSGCAFSPENGASCDDDDACTEGDKCVNKGCVGAAKSCDDGNSCTTDSCDAKKGCQSVPGKDGGTCSLADPCASAGVCGTGVCKAGKKLWTVSFGSAGNETAMGLVALGANNVVAAGWLTESGKGQQGWLARLGPDGSAAWQTKVGGTDHDTFRDIAQLDDKTLVAVGEHGATNSKVGAAWAVAVDVDGKLLWQQTYPDTLGEQAGRSAPHPAGFVWGGARHTSDALAGVIGLVDKSGKQIWKRPMSADKWTSVDGVVAMPGQRIAVAAKTGPESASRGLWLLVYDRHGDRLWQRHWPRLPIKNPRRMRVFANGDLLVAATRPKAVNDAELMRIGPEGHMVWARVLGTGTAHRQIRDIRVLPGGEVLFAGEERAKDGKSSRAWIGRVSGAGALMQQALIGDDKSITEASAVAAAADGGVWWAGRVNGNQLATKGGDDIVIGRLDAALASGCDGKSKCLDPAKGCDDSNPCTSDLCVAGAGCVNLPATLPCDDNDPCTMAEHCLLAACKKGSAVAVDAVGAISAATLYAAVPLDGGGWIAAGEDINSGAKPRTWVGRWDRDGELVKSITIGDGTVEHAVRGIAMLTEEFVLIPMSYAPDDSNKSRILVHRRHWDLLDWVSDLVYDAPHRQHVHDIAARADGKMVAVGLSNEQDGAAFQGLIVRFEPNGKGTKRTLYGAPSQLRRVIVRSDGIYLAAGRRALGTGKGWDFMLVFTDHNGKTHGIHHFDGGGKDDQVHDLVELADGTILLVGGQDTAGGARLPWVVATDGSGNKIWQHLESSWHHGNYMAATQLQDGSVALSGTARDSDQNLPGGHFPVLQRLDRFGNVLHTGTFSGPTSKAAGNTLVYESIATNTGLLMLGQTHTGSAAKGWWARLDPFSKDGACSGACAAMTTGQCDDGNPCTADLCAAGKCTHKSLNDGTLCGANKTCSSGACK